jgi:hypothetical protein
MEYERHLRKAAKDMRAAEERLLKSGFSSDQWVDIKLYIQASILRFQLLYGRALQDAIVREEE